MRITRRVEFSSSHTCRHPALSPEENKAVYGEASHPCGHGHNFALEVALEGEPDTVTGMIVDLKAVKQILEEEVVGPFDHRHLNHEVPPFDRVVPTVENMAIEIWRRLAPRFEATPARLKLVRLFETADLYVEFEGQP